MQPPQSFATQNPAPPPFVGEHHRENPQQLRLGEDLKEAPLIASSHWGSIFRKKLKLEALEELPPNTNHQPPTTSVKASTVS